VKNELERMRKAEMFAGFDTLSKNIFEKFRKAKKNVRRVQV
jgi:hypothetical protein